MMRVFAAAALTLLVYPAHGAEPPPSNWTASFAGPVALRLPPKYEIRKRSVDTLMWEYSGPGYSFELDYGRFATESVPTGKSDFENWKAQIEMIGGRPARVVTYQKGRRRFVSSFWRDVKPGIHLSISGWSDGEELTALNIVRSVRFGRGRLQTFEVPLR